MNVVRRLLRYGTGSLVSTTLSMSILGALVYFQTMSATWANVVATAAGTVPFEQDELQDPE
jgi:putative flippase GtrA